MSEFTLSPIWGAGAQLFDNNGNPLSGGKIYTYYAGTTTPAATYTTVLGTIQNSNPIVANAAGRLTDEIWLPNGTSYKYVLKDANDVLIATYDNIPTISGSDAAYVDYEPGYTVTAGNFTIGATYQIASLGNTNFTSIGAPANVVGVHFTATGVGVGSGTALYTRTVQAKLRETVSVKDFGAVGDGTTDDSAAFQAALNSGYDIFVPQGVYYVHDLTCTDRASFTGVSTDWLSSEGAIGTHKGSIINTKGDNFITSASSSVIYIANNIDFVSTGQNGRCFDSSYGGAGECGFEFQQVSIIEFEYGFRAPSYSSTSHADRLLVRECEYGMYLQEASNITSITRSDFLFNGLSLRIGGYNILLENIQLGTGYTGKNASSKTQFICIQIWSAAFISLTNIYNEAYGGDTSKVVLFDMAFVDPNETSVVMTNCDFTAISETKIADIQASTAWTGSNSAPFVGKIVLINCSRSPKVTVKPGFSNPISGIYEYNGSSVSNAYCVVFNKYNVTVNLGVGDADGYYWNYLPTQAYWGIQFPRTSIVNYDKYLNFAGGGAFNDIYSSSTQTFNVPNPTSPVKINYDLKVTGLTSAGPYRMVASTRNSSGGAVISDIGTFYATDQFGGAFTLYACGYAEVTFPDSQHFVQIGFRADYSALPTINDTQIAAGLSGTIQVRSAIDN